MSSLSRALILSAALAVPVFADARAADRSAPSNGSAASEKLQEVTVTAERGKLLPRVRKFVDQVVTPENNGEDGIARWHVPPVCPLVSGLTRQHGEFILARLSEIAEKAGAPLAGEHCRPNLYILVTPQPAELLRAMEKRNRSFTFGYETFGDTGVANSSETPEGVVNHFIETPRAVRVWYNANQTDPWGQPLGICQGAQLLAECLADPLKHPICSPNVHFRCGRQVSAGSHITLGAMTTFSRVFVIVDRTRLPGVTFGQLAVYVAMVGLARLKPDADLRDAPTILKLFDGAPQTAPPSLTDWDQAFLKSLYATNRLVREQSGRIARAMVREIVH